MTTVGSAESQCGWLTDRFGVSWQITPTRLLEMMSSDDVSCGRAYDCGLHDNAISWISLDWNRRFAMSKPKPARHTPEEVDLYLAAQVAEFCATLDEVAKNR